MLHLEHWAALGFEDVDCFFCWEDLEFDVFDVTAAEDADGGGL